MFFLHGFCSVFTLFLLCSITHAASTSTLQHVDDGGVRVGPGVAFRRVDTPVPAFPLVFEGVGADLVPVEGCEDVAVRGG